MPARPGDLPTTTWTQLGPGSWAVPSECGSGTRGLGRDGKVAAFVSGYMAGEVLLEGALAEAGIKVDPAMVAKAVEDQKKRDAPL